MPEEVKTTQETVVEPAADVSPIETTSINGRPCQTLVLGLTGHKVFIAEYLTAGEDEDATETLIGKDTIIKQQDDGIAYRNTIEQKYLLMQSGIKKILDKDGREVTYTREWYRALPTKDAKQIQVYVRENYLSSEKKNTDATGAGPNS